MFLFCEKVKLNLKVIFCQKLKVNLLWSIGQIILRN